MKTEYLFMAGEYKVSMPLVFRTRNWRHTMSQTRLKLENGKLFYWNEPLLGVIHYANCQDSELERDNLEAIKQSGVSCWPCPDRLLRMLSRHEVMQECIDAGLVTNDQVHVLPTDEPWAIHVPVDLPYVIKTTNEHRGLGKHLIKTDTDFHALDFTGLDLVTVEPFYKGRSIRVLRMSPVLFGIEIVNDSNWIKNAPGAEAHRFDLRGHADMVDHALSVAEHFGLDCAGVDYILEEDGTFHLLEINQYPGLATTDEVEEYAKIFLKRKMEEIEND